jgi:hypothetical protein
MANETTAVKDPIKKMLKARGIQHITITTNGFGSSGWPDICFLYRGVFVGIECKFGKNKPSALQEQKLDYIKAQGGIAMLVNEENVGDVGSILNFVDGATREAIIDKAHTVSTVLQCCAGTKLKLWRD